MSQIKVRINGRGNAWPVILGHDHPFYDRTNIEDLANASCSIIKSDKSNPKETEIIWDLMIDAGHGAVQYLLKNCNRIPDAIFLTHPHLDHILGLDWIVQSFYKLYKKSYPVYSTILCWEKVKNLFPHLTQMINFKELVPYQKSNIEEVEGVEVIPYPVYHGKSADGATMLFFTINNERKVKKVLFTGDVLCPLLRDEDYKKLLNLDLLVCDANNRFPYPNSNHWSILNGFNDQPSIFLNEFINNNTVGLLLYPHLKNQISNSYCRCFDYFLNKEFHLSNFIFSINSFISFIRPEKTALIHYSGSEDERYYADKILSHSELELWLKKVSENLKITTEFLLPYVSEHIDFL